MIQRWTYADGDDGPEMWRDDKGAYVIFSDHEVEIAKYKDAPAAVLPRLVVCAVIIRDGRVLLERRAPAGVPGLDGKWDLPGGKVEPGETPKEAIIREISEELWVSIRPGELIPHLPTSTWKYPDGEQRHWILAAYPCTIIGGEPLCCETLRWVSLEKLHEIEILDADYHLIQMAKSAL